MYVCHLNPVNSNAERQERFEMLLSFRYFEVVDEMKLLHSKYSKFHTHAHLPLEDYRKLQIYLFEYFWMIFVRC